MAASGSIENRSLEELESEITCGICQEHYTEPKILPCLHYYCKQCILKLALRSATGKPFSCPECRCAATLPEGGVDQLKTAFFINRLKSKVTTIERVQGKVEVKCELCEDSTSNAEAFCRQCAMFICKECVLLHNKLKTYKTHEVASLDDLKHSRAKVISEKESIKKCETHEKSLKIYCFNCNCLICQHCTVKDHRDHDFEFTKKAAPEVKARLLEEINPLKYLNQKLVQATESIQHVKAKVDNQWQSVINSIHTSFKELHDILNKHEKELVQQANTLSQGKVEKLSEQEKNLSLASAEIQNVVEYTERCVSLSTDNEVMSMHTEIEKAIQQKIQQHNQAGRSLEPVEEADVGVEVKCAEVLKQLCQTQAIITKLCVDPTKCTVDLPEHAEVGKLSTATLITRLSNNKQAKRNCKIFSQIKSLHIGVITDGKIDEDGSGRYSIHYTPTVRGRHELTVLVDGQHIAGSPFPVYVSIHPTKLGKPVEAWVDLTGPLCVTSNTKGEILITERTENIFKITADGHIEKLATVKKLKILRGIACDDEDNIYCIDENTNMIFTCDKNGGNKQIHTVEMDKKATGRAAICKVHNFFIIAEVGVRKIIKLYNRSLKYLRDIRHDDMGLVNGLSTDFQGNVYVADGTNSFIHVFNGYGDCLRSITNEKKKMRPCGVCVFGQYLYVTDVGSHCVCVFTTDGEYITSFGQKGSKEGDFNCPVGIHLDRDGLVFVCDRNNKRVLCY